MKVKYYNVLDIETPSFAFIICEQDGLYYTAVYSPDDTVDSFVEVNIVDAELIDALEDVEINLSDKRIFAYNVAGEIIVGNAKDIAPLLEGLIVSKQIPYYCINNIADFFIAYDYHSENCKHKYKKPYAAYQSVTKYIAEIDNVKYTIIIQYLKHACKRYEHGWNKRRGSEYIITGEDERMLSKEESDEILKNIMGNYNFFKGQPMFLNKGTTKFTKQKRCVIKSHKIHLRNMHNP